MKTGEEAQELARSVRVTLSEWEPSVITKALVVEEDVTLSPREGDTLLLIIKSDAVIRESGSGAFDVFVVCTDNVRVRYYSVTTGCRVVRTAYVHADASIDWVDTAFGGAASQVTSYLLGTGAHAEFQSVFLGKDEEKYDIHSSMVHYGNNSTSNMVTRSVMLDKSSGRYEGLIRIDKDAAGCDAYQKEDTLLLSPDANMDATPNLEISNEDVRCSHGVSLSQLDEEKIFYFRSRGIPKKAAVDLVIHGFFDEILDRMGPYASDVRKQLFGRLA